MSMITTRGLNLQWNDFGAINADIDLAVAAGLNAVFLGYTNAIRAQYDTQIRAAFAYGITKGVKVHIVMSPIDYGVTATTTAAFLADLQYVVTTYAPLGLGGIQINQPSDVSNLASFLNSFFTSCKAIITGSAYISSLDYGVTVSTNSAAGLTSGGIDLVTINGSGAFSATAGTALFKYIESQYISIDGDGSYEYGYWGAVGANLVKVFYLEIENNLNVFNQIRYALTKSLGVVLSYQGALALPASAWPADTTAGATAGAKIKTILGSTAPPSAGLQSMIITPSDIAGPLSNVEGYAKITVTGTNPIRLTYYRANVQIGLKTITLNGPWIDVDYLHIGIGTFEVKTSDGVNSFIQLITLPGTLCSPVWVCRIPLDGYEVNQCDATARLNPACNPLPAAGSLFVSSNPPGATIILNGVVQ